MKAFYGFFCCVHGELIYTLHEPRDSRPGYLIRSVNLKTSLGEPESVIHCHFRERRIYDREGVLKGLLAGFLPHEISLMLRAGVKSI